jgi:AraC-like DNA-binding protein
MPHSSPTITFKSYSALTEAHAHPFFQIVLPCCGVLELEIEGRGGRIDAGRAAVIGAGEVHAFSAHPTTNRFLVLDVVASTVASRSSKDLLDKLAERRYVTQLPAVHHLVAYAEGTAASGWCTQDNTRHCELWLDLLLEASSQESGRTRVGSSTTLTRATAFLNRSYQQRVRMADLARVAGLGASRLYELFQLHLGTTPRNYLADVRLRQALELLAHSNLSIAEIAVRTGHADQSTLTRQLRRKHGITPAAYRRALLHTTQGGESAQNIGDCAKRK